MTLNMLAALFGLRCILMTLTIGVAYAYSWRVVDFLTGKQTEDRLGTAIWLFAMGNGATNINSGWLMLATPREFHGSFVAVFAGLTVITMAHYLALTAWSAYRYDIPVRRVAFHAGAFLTVVGLTGALAFRSIGT